MSRFALLRGGRSFFAHESTQDAVRILTSTRLSGRVLVAEIHLTAQLGGDFAVLDQFVSLLPSQ